MGVVLPNQDCLFFINQPIKMRGSINPDMASSLVLYSDEGHSINFMTDCLCHVTIFISL
jgi:hypothetical protein